jgi:hypothetical protein
MAACSNEDFFVEGTQAVEQESVLNVADITVTPLMTSAIDVNELLSIQAEDSLYIPLGVVSVKENALVKGVQLQSKIQVSANEDFSDPMNFDGESMEGNDTIRLSPKALQEAYYANVTHSPKQKTLYVRSMVQTVTNGTSVAYVGSGGSPAYYTTGSVAFTPLDMHIVIERAYYYLGSLATDQTYKLTNSGADPYDDPVFSVTIPAQGDGWHWFKIAPESAYNEDGTMNWDKEMSCICPLISDDSERSGKCQNGKLSWHLLEDDGAKFYTITINAMDMTFDITPVFFSDFVYLACDYNGWSTSASPLAHLGGGEYEGFYYIQQADEASTWGFKFVIDGAWSGGSHDVATSGNYELGQGGNLNCATAFYQVRLNQVNNSYTLNEVNSMSIIGSAVNGDSSWGTDADMTFSVNEGCWIYAGPLTAGEFKFRMNHDWSISWGGTADDELTNANGANLKIEQDGDYMVKFWPNCNGKGVYTMAPAN